MPPCENNPKCTNRTCPISNRRAKFGANPDSIYSTKPSWNFSKCDNDSRWAFTEKTLGNAFWTVIMPKLKDYEQQTWGKIEGDNSHFVNKDTLNKCARDRLDELKITEDRIFSLRLGGKLRIYGLRPKFTLFILWYDNDHGDNNTCVCRSTLKHT